MKRICLHLTALVVLMPCLLMFNAGDGLWLNVLGIIYTCYLIISWNESDTTKRFVRRYYHEILRLENMMM